MDNDIRELLKQVVDGVVNGDENSAAEAFSKYATIKTRELVEAGSNDTSEDTNAETTE